MSLEHRSACVSESRRSLEPPSGPATLLIGCAEPYGILSIIQYSCISASVPHVMFRLRKLNAEDLFTPWKLNFSPKPKDIIIPPKNRTVNENQIST